METWSPLICAEITPSRGSGYIELRENMCILIFPVFFIVDTTSMSKLVFSITYCFRLDSHLSGCVAVIINDVVSLFLCYCNGYSCLCDDGYHHYCYFCDPCHILL